MYGYGTEMWPPSSPDLNPLDYTVWSVVEFKACVQPHANVAALKTSMNREWAKISEAYIRRTCGWRP